MTNNEIDLDKVVDILRETHGIDNAYVEQTGGGCATIYAGPEREDDGGYTRHAALAGPGWFAGRNWTQPRANLSDFYVGPDDDGEGDAYSFAEGVDEIAVAGMIAAQASLPDPAVSIANEMSDTEMIDFCHDLVETDNSYRGLVAKTDGRMVSPKVNRWVLGSIVQTFGLPMTWISGTIAVVELPDGPITITQDKDGRFDVSFRGYTWQRCTADNCSEHQHQDGAK